MRYNEISKYIYEKLFNFLFISIYQYIYLVCISLKYKKYSCIIINVYKYIINEG